MDQPGTLQILVIGVGNYYHSDDAAGLQVVRRLKAGELNAVTLLEHSGEGAGLMEAWKGADAVILIDAVSSGAPPGTIHHFELFSKPLPAAMFKHSTHAFSIPQAIELSRTLNQLPGRLVIFGIEGQNFEAGTELSAQVAEALPEAAKQVIREVKRLRSQSKSED
jgi:hydrogenase maturation protease